MGKSKTITKWPNVRHLDPNFKKQAPYLKKCFQLTKAILNSKQVIKALAFIYRHRTAKRRKDFTKYKVRPQDIQALKTYLTATYQFPSISVKSMSDWGYCDPSESKVFLRKRLTDAMCKAKQKKADRLTIGKLNYMAARTLIHELAHDLMYGALVQSDVKDKNMPKKPLFEQVKNSYDSGSYVEREIDGVCDATWKNNVIDKIGIWVDKKKNANSYTTTYLTQIIDPKHWTNHKFKKSEDLQTSEKWKGSTVPVHTKQRKPKTAKLLWVGDRAKRKTPPLVGKV